MRDANGRELIYKASDNSSTVVSEADALTTTVTLRDSTAFGVAATASTGAASITFTDPVIVASLVAALETAWVISRRTVTVIP